MQYIKSSILAVLALFVLVTSAASADGRPKSSDPQPAGTQDGSAANIDEASASDRQVADSAKPSSELEPYRRDLLMLAIEAASKMPIDPHLKDRSKAQSIVVDACLDLDQPDLAETCNEYVSIESWRRGVGFADIAFHYARTGAVDRLPRLLGMADQIAMEVEGWRRDRIRVAMARTYAWLGRDAQANQLQTDLHEAEVGKVETVHAMKTTEEDFDRRLVALDNMVATNTLDVVRNALDAYIELYRRVYDDNERRAIVEERAREAWRSVPIMVRLEFMMELIQVTLDQGDRVRALGQVNEARDTLNNYTWLAEDEVPLRARLAKLRAASGESDGARAELALAMKRFNDDKRTIANIYWATGLRAIAEALVALGDDGAALAMYKEAVEAGVANPNSRPRADDLAATCTSLAVHELRPDEELWSRLREIYSELGHPW